MVLARPLKLMWLPKPLLIVELVLGLFCDEVPRARNITRHITKRLQVKKSFKRRLSGIAISQLLALRNRLTW